MLARKRPLEAKEITRRGGDSDGAVPVIQPRKSSEIAFGPGCLVRLIVALLLVVGTIAILWYRYVH